MNTTIQAEVLARVTAALVELELYRACSPNPPARLATSGSVAQGLAEYAIETMERAGASETQLQRLLVDLYDARHATGGDLQRSLLEIRLALGANTPLAADPGYQVAALSRLEALFRETFRDLAGESDLERMAVELRRLEKASGKAYYLLGQGAAKPSAEMMSVMRDFDHLHEDWILQAVSLRVRDGTEWTVHRPVWIST